MAPTTLVLDASVGVKWFSNEGEDALKQALKIRDAHISRDLTITVPDLFYYEVINAIVYKKSISVASIQMAVTSLFDLGLESIPISTALMGSAVSLAREYSITIYDSFYLAIAQFQNCPLITANPRHQRSIKDCQVIPIMEWK